MIFNWPPQFGQCSMSISKTRFSSLAQLTRTGRWCAHVASHTAGCAACAGGSGSCALCATYLSVPTAAGIHSGAAVHMQPAASGRRVHASVCPWVDCRYTAVVLDRLLALPLTHN